MEDESKIKSWWVQEKKKCALNDAGSREKRYVRRERERERTLTGTLEKEVLFLSGGERTELLYTHRCAHGQRVCELNCAGEG